MKRIFLGVIFLLCVIIPFYCWAQWGFSVTGDIQWCREKITINPVFGVPSYTIRSKYIILPKAGAYADYHFSHSFFLRSGMVIDGKGAKYTDPGSLEGPNTVLFHNTYFYLETPLFIIASPELFHTRHLYGGVGLFMGYGLGRWYKNEDASTHKVLIKGQVRFRGKNSNGLKNFDSGINFLVGYRLGKRFSIHFIYQYGLMDIYNGPNTSYNRALGTGIDYTVR